MPIIPRKDVIVKEHSKPILLGELEVKDRLGVNIFDINLIPDELRLRLKIGEKVNTTPIWVDRNNSTEYCLEFTCDITHAATLCDIMRKWCKDNNERPTRVYIFKKSVWTKLPQDTILTVVNRAGKVELNDEIFNIKRPLVKWTPRE